MRNALHTLVFVLSASLMLGACDSSGDDEDQLEGTWELLAPEDPLDPVDVLYLHIANNEGTIYDFRGDEMDAGPDCYLIDTFQLEHVDDDRYRLSSPEFEGVAIDVTMRVRGDALTMSSTLFDSMSFRRSDKRVSDFTPICEDDFEEADKRKGRAKMGFARP